MKSNHNKMSTDPETWKIFTEPYNTGFQNYVIFIWFKIIQIIAMTRVKVIWGLSQLWFNLCLMMITVSGYEWVQWGFPIHFSPFIAIFYNNFLKLKHRINTTYTILMFRNLYYQWQVLWPSNKSFLGSCQNEGGITSHLCHTDMRYHRRYFFNESFIQVNNIELLLIWRMQTDHLASCLTFSTNTEIMIITIQYTLQH